MRCLVDLKNLHKRFGPFTAVDGVSFSVDQGEVLGFLGPNGAGKSTTMKMVTGFLAPDAGSVTVCGHDLDRDPIAVKRCIGYLPEGAPAYPDMTVAAFLEFIADVRGLRGASRRARIEATVAGVNLEGVLQQPIETLSKGFKRRVGLAQAILHDPPVLILDEPTDGLDPNQKHEVRTLIKSMASEKAIVLSTHILEEVDAVCTRAIIIAGGKLVADGTPEELAARAGNGAVIVALAQAPADTGEQLRRLPGVGKVQIIPGGAQGRPRFQLNSKSPQETLDAVARTARDRAWEITELYSRRGGLDDVFRAITSKHQAIS